MAGPERALTILQSNGQTRLGLGLELWRARGVGVGPTYTLHIVRQLSYYTCNVCRTVRSVTNNKICRLLACLHGVYTLRPVVQPRLGE